MPRYSREDREQIEAARQRRIEEARERARRRRNRQRPPGADTTPVESKRRPPGAIPQDEIRRLRAAAVERPDLRENPNPPRTLIDYPGSGAVTSQQRQQSRIDQGRRDLDRFHDVAQTYQDEHAQSVGQFLLGTELEKLLSAVLPGGRPIGDVRDVSPGGLGIDLAAALLPVKGVRGAVGKVARPAIRTVGEAAQIPAARSVAGRAVERAASAARPLASKATGGRVRSEAYREGQEITRSAQRMRASMDFRKRIEKVASRLDPVEENAVLMSLEGVTPAARRAKHLELAEQAKDAASRTAHMQHVRMVDDAVKRGLVDEAAGLGAKAPAKVRELRRLITKAGDSREQIIREYRILMDDVVENRPQKLADVYGETVAEGARYTPKRRGIPGTSSGRVRRATQVMRAFGASPSRVLKGVPEAERRAIQREFTGKSVLSGWFRTDVGRLTEDALDQALSVRAKDHVRRTLLKTASETLPDGATLRDWVPIYTDEGLRGAVGEQAREKLRMVVDLMDGAEEGLHLPADKLNDVAGEMPSLEKLLYMDEVEMQRAFDRAIASEARSVPGVAWVKRDTLAGAGMLDPPGGLLRSLSRGAASSKAGKSALGAAHKANMAMLLYLSPSYIPVNLVSNGGMLAIQQGILMPRNMAIATGLWKDAVKGGVRLKANEAGDTLAFLDRVMGPGFVGSSTKGAGAALDSLGHAVNALVDIWPRRLAFIHEASRVGVKGKAGLRDLARRAEMGDEAALQKVDMIARRAVDAILDFDRATHPFEREFLKNTLLFYPWLRASTRYTTRLPLDRPGVSAGLGYAGLKYKQEVDERQEGMLLPRGFEGALPMGDRTGSVQHFLDPATLFTPSQTVDVVRNLFDAAKGDRDAGLDIVGQLNPMLGSALRGIFGIDRYGNQASSGGPGLAREFRDFYERTAPVRNIGLLTGSRDPGSTMIPRTGREELLRAGIGNTYYPVDLDVAREVEQRTNPRSGEVLASKQEEAGKDTTGAIVAEFGEGAFDEETLRRFETAARAEEMVKQRLTDVYAQEREDRDIEKGPLPERVTALRRAEAWVEVAAELSPGDAEWLREVFQEAAGVGDVVFLENVEKAAQEVLGVQMMRNQRGLAERAARG